MSFIEQLSTLHRRTFADEIAVVEGLSRQPDPAGVLLRSIDDWQREAHEWSTSVEALAHTLSDVTEAQRFALLGTWLRRNSPVHRLAGDLAALSRNLGLDAIRERALAHQDRLGTLTEFALVALLVALREDPERRPVAGARLRRVLHAHQRPQTRRRAASCLVDLVQQEPNASWADSARNELVQASLQNPDVWTRRQAVRVVAQLDAGEREALLLALAASPDHDAALVRAAAVEALTAVSAWEMVARFLDDPAEIVRFAVIEAAVAVDEGQVWERASEHREPRTRAWLAHCLVETPGADAVLAGLVRDADPFVRSFALGSVAERAKSGSIRTELVEAVEGGLDHPELVVRRGAERVLAWVAYQGSKAKGLTQRLTSLRSGQSTFVKLPMGMSAIDLAIALRPFALGGYGFTLRPGRGGVRVVRGETMGFAWWRVFHEVRNPAPSKRQGYTHAVGPRLEGPIRIPPSGLAEQSATGIPGQRVQVDGGDWGPHLPTLDDYRRALAYGSALVVSSAGITEVRPPAGILARIRARWSLLWRVDALHQERMSALEQRHDERFLARFEGMGFVHGRRLAVGGFLPYLLGTSGNTLLHLGIMLALFWFLLVGANVWLRTKVLLYRRKIGLVIGGWGTRGKSGTERIKAGMLTGLGVPYVSKTTGCEAMILHGPRGGRIRELFLFRPFDKATIWEQADVMRFAAHSGARMMIWECMALNPRYVDILQRGWMRDDLSTLTNAYPDHEDVMGPTGMDVAQVIGSFAPSGSPLFTTEENMYPTIVEQAERFGSLPTCLSRAEKELIPTELIERFPYAEHPSNIALAARVGTELGVHRVEAIGWMADHVVPDLGALMVYPEVEIDQRRVVFVNGHSANDELSFTHSWRHTGMAAHRVAAHPEQWLIGLINNRADRVPRSRVFARMAVRVAGAHRFLVIGTNLSGFLGFMDEALEELLHGLDLEEQEQWERWSEHLKIPDPRGWLFYLLRQRGVDPSELFEPFEELKPVASIDAAREQVEGLELELVESVAPELLPWVQTETPYWLALRGATTQAERKALFRARIRSRVSLLPDPGASGDQVVAACVQLVPPGSPVRLMGMQNIKGTGLDFVYQWVRWRTLHADLQILDEEAIRQFSPQRLTSVFHCDATLKALAGRADGSGLALAVTQRRLELMELRLATPSGSAIGRAVRRWLWRLYDPIDAIWRRRRSRQVLADLAMERIGHDEAEQILAALTKRQKG